MRFALLLCLSRLVLSIHGQNAADVDSSSSSISLEFDGMTDEESQRHKRALGILLQGFMEALGYQVSPIQIATLPAQNPVAAAAAPPMMQLMPNGSSMPAAAPTPRQRETLRFTGVFNFGNNVNATNLVDHLAQYERIFHGNNGSATAPAASTGNKSKKKSKKQKKPPIPDPLFVKIPLPIAPDLPVPQPMPDDHEFYDHSSHEQHLDEFHESDDEGGKHGHYQEEHDDSRHSEEYQKNHEHYEDYEPYNRNYPGNKGKEEEEEEDDNNNNNSSGGGPKEKLTEYKNNRNVVNYRVENKELHHPDEVAEEAPPPMSPPLTTLVDVDGPASDWRETDEKRALEVAAEQEALAEALAEKNAERESEARNRERERDDEGEANYEAAVKLLCDENCEDSEVNGYGKSEDDADEDVEEAADDNANKENNQRSYQARPVQTWRQQHMFKDPDSGLYDPDRIKEYESARLPFYDYSEFLDGFNKIQRQMSGGGGNKYEEYDIDKSLAGDLRAEHRSREEADDSGDAASRSANKCKCDNNNDKSGEDSKERSAAAGSTTRSFGPAAQKAVAAAAAAAAAAPGLPSTTFSPYFFASYDPYETKEEIIARLTSYEPITRPATAALFSADDARTLSPSLPPPIGFAAERLLHDDAAEIKEIESWPEARPSPSVKTLNLFRPAQLTASTRKKQQQQQNVEILDENNRTPWVPLVPIDAKRRSSSSEQQQRSQSNSLLRRRAIATTHQDHEEEEEVRLLHHEAGDGEIRRVGLGRRADDRRADVELRRQGRRRAADSRANAILLRRKSRTVRRRAAAERQQRGKRSERQGVQKPCRVRESLGAATAPGGHDAADIHVHEATLKLLP
ncbi:unnamed protein product [Trichogramma brassicae]|uniref:Uncharacterized protein n=1 Tax=Trichogramma brassicae TaxID=86971 RepID=A0A6H5IFP1_9HYME|nr:unnamed protein product [Trichogramma brassicae]